MSEISKQEREAMIEVFEGHLSRVQREGVDRLWHGQAHELYPEKRFLHGAGIHKVSQFL